MPEQMSAERISFPSRSTVYFSLMVIRAHLATLQILEPFADLVQSLAAVHDWVSLDSAALYEAR
jgi:hypothetical protein